jgi:hypothetical protein
MPVKSAYLSKVNNSIASYVNVCEPLNFEIDLVRLLTVTLYFEECFHCAGLSFSSSQLNPVSHNVIPVCDRVLDNEHDKHCTYIITMRRVRTTSVAVEEQYV